jgi:hypothetical protein
MTRTAQIVRAVLATDPEITPDQTRAVLDVLERRAVRIRAAEAARILGISKREFYRRRSQFTPIVEGRKAVFYDRDQITTLSGVGNEDAVQA